MENIKEIIKYDEAQLYAHNIEEEIARTKKELRNLPLARIDITKNGKYEQWRVETGSATVIEMAEKNGWRADRKRPKKKGKDSVRFYLPKNASDYAARLVHREFLQNNLKLLKICKSTIDNYLSQCAPYIEENRALVSNHAKMQLYDDVAARQNDRLDAWMKLPYERNRGYENQRIISSDTFNTLSKAEDSIIDKATSAGWHLWYEPKILIPGEFDYSGNQAYEYPDIVLVHPRTKKIMIWEHCGLMDDPAYMKKTARRLLHYSQLGFLLNRDIFVTTETSQRPLSAMEIDEMIHLVGSRKHGGVDWDVFKQYVVWQPDADVDAAMDFALE